MDGNICSELEEGVISLLQLQTTVKIQQQDEVQSSKPLSFM